MIKSTINNSSNRNAGVSVCIDSVVFLPADLGYSRDGSNKLEVRASINGETYGFMQIFPSAVPFKEAYKYAIRNITNEVQERL